MVSFTMVIVIPRVIIPTRYRSRNRDVTLAAPRICRYRFLHGTGAPNWGSDLSVKRSNNSTIGRFEERDS